MIEKTKQGQHERNAIFEELKNKRRRFVGNLGHPISSKQERTKAACYCGHQDAIPGLGAVLFSLLPSPDPVQKSACNNS